MGFNCLKAIATSRRQFEAAPSIMAQSWPLGSQIAEKKSIEKEIVVSLTYLQSFKLPVILLMGRSNLKYCSSCK